jgi:WS/DGAT/MGAT family acyltransferase
MVPRMRQRAVEPPLGVGTPTWVTQPDLDLDRHLGRIRLPAPSLRALLDTVQELAAAPLDRDRPLWRAALVEGLPGGTAAYVAVTHRSVTDGMGAVQLMELLHSRAAAHDPSRPEPPVPAPGREPSPVAQLAGLARELPGAALRRGGPLAGALSRPWGLAGDAAEAARGVGQRADTGSPLLAERSGRWHVELLEVSLDRLRAGAEAAGGSVNDGLLAAVLGAFDRYHRELGADPDELTVGVPLSLRGADDPSGGPAPAVLTAGRVGAAGDTAARIRAVREFVLETAGRAPADPLAPVLGALPAALAGGRPSPVADVRVGTLPGVGHPVYLAGSRITRAFPYGPPAGCAAAITLLPHDGTCCLGITLDPAAVTEPGVLVAALHAALADVTALAP